MTTRRTLVLAAAALPLCAWLNPVRAQSSARKVARIGVLIAESGGVFVRGLDALRAGLRELGYVEGANTTIEYRFAEGKYERLPALAADLVRSKVDVIVTQGTPATRAAKETTSTVPIVMTTSGDAVATGLVANLARPGGNVTGSTFLSPEVHAKRLDLLKEALPRIARIAYFNNPANPIGPQNAKAMDAAAVSLKVSVRRVDVRDAAELAAAFPLMAENRVEGLVMGQDSLIAANHKRIADLAMKQRLPAIGAREFAEAGGPFGYGHVGHELWRRAATYVDKILKGAKPADLPVERPTKFELVVNLKAAKALGVSVPNSILQRAEKLIE